MSDPDEKPGFLLDRSDAWLSRLTATLERRAPALVEVGIRTGWAGLYEMTPDHNAVIGLSASGLAYATGFSGHGLLMAPAVGETIRDLVLGRSPAVEVGVLSADRFADRGARPEIVIV
jgi:sarcosine oxidase subunit beta